MENKDLILCVFITISFLLIFAGVGIATIANNVIGCYIVTVGMCFFPFIIWFACNDDDN